MTRKGVNSSNDHGPETPASAVMLENQNLVASICLARHRLPSYRSWLLGWTILLVHWARSWRAHAPAHAVGALGTVRARPRTHGSTAGAHRSAAGAHGSRTGTHRPPGGRLWPTIARSSHRSRWRLRSGVAGATVAAVATLRCHVSLSRAVVRPARDGAARVDGRASRTAVGWPWLHGPS